MSYQEVTKKSELSPGKALRTAFDHLFQLLRIV